MTSSPALLGAPRRVSHKGRIPVFLVVIVVIDVRIVQVGLDVRKLGRGNDDLRPVGGGLRVNGDARQGVSQVIRDEEDGRARYLDDLIPGLLPIGEEAEDG